MPMTGTLREGRAMPHPLEKELETYNREKQNLLEHAGKFVLISDDHVESVWDTYQDAIKAGYDKFGLKPFLVKRIEAIEQVHYCTRSVEPICQR